MRVASGWIGVLLGLVGAILLLTGCSPAPPVKNLRLDDVEAASAAERPKGLLLRVAVASVISPKNTVASYSDLVDYLGAAVAPQVEMTLFRIIQEALTNVAKHSQARNVSVVLERRTGSVVALVEDDGVGFDVQQVLDSPLEEAQLGLHGMRERASLVGGQLVIESGPGRGTTVQVEIPIESEDAAEPEDPAVEAAASAVRR